MVRNPTMPSTFSDLLTPTVVAWINTAAAKSLLTRGYLTAREVLTHALEIDAPHTSRAWRLRVGFIMRHLGFQPRRIIVGGARTNVYADPRVRTPLPHTSLCCGKPFPPMTEGYACPHCGKPLHPTERLHLPPRAESPARAAVRAIREARRAQ